MNEAIKLAIEEGDYPNLHLLDTEDENSGLYRIVQDPFFWQALGKALGWKEQVCNYCAEPTDDEEEICNLCDGDFVEGHVDVVPEWQYYAHEWLDAHFEGQEAEERFWTALLNP